MDYWWASLKGVAFHEPLCRTINWKQKIVTSIQSKTRTNIETYFGVLHVAFSITSRLSFFSIETLDNLVSYTIIVQNIFMEKMKILLGAEEEEKLEYAVVWWDILEIQCGLVRVYKSNNLVFDGSCASL